MEQQSRLIGTRQQVDLEVLRRLSRDDRLALLSARCFGRAFRADARSLARMRARLKEVKSR